MNRKAFFAASPLVALISIAASTAAFAIGCDDPQPPAATPDRGAATATPSASPTAATTIAVAPTATAEVAPSASASAEEAASASPSGAASAAPSGSAAAAPAAKGFAFPSPKTGILSPAEADKLAKIGTAARVRLLDAGKEPLAALAYAPSKGSTQPLRIDLGTSLSVFSGGQPVTNAKFPSQSMDVDMQTEEAGDASGALVAMLLRGITTQVKDGVDKETADVMTKQLSGLTGYTLRERVGAHGDVTETKVVVPDSFPKGTEQLLQNISSTFQSLVPRLPDDAVGTGARWQVLSREEAPGTSFVQLTEYTLKERSGTKVTLDYSARQLAAGDAIKLPAGMPEGQSMKLAKFVTTIAGSIGIDTAQMGPVKGRRTQDSKLTFLVSAPSADKDAGPSDPIKADVEMKLTATIARRGIATASAASAAPTATAAPAPTAKP